MSHLIKGFNYLKKSILFFWVTYFYIFQKQGLIYNVFKNYWEIRVVKLLELAIRLSVCKNSLVLIKIGKVVQSLPDWKALCYKYVNILELYESTHLMRLFKYLTPERTDVLKNQSIRFTQAKHLNDPFEWLPFVNRLMSEIAAKNFYTNFVAPSISETSDRKLKLNDIPEEFRDKIPKEILDEVFKLTLGEGLNLIPQFHPENLAQLLFASRGVHFNINISELLKDSWNKYFGVLSLTQSNCNIPMWSHYAQNHEGFVIEFNPDNNFFKTQNNDKEIAKELKSVQYTSERKEINIIEEGDDETSILRRIADEVFFTKSNHWKDEEEVRILDRLANHNRKIQTGDQEIYLFDFEPKAVTAIYFGVNISDKTRGDINSILDSDLFHHVERLSGELDVKEYKINFTKKAGI